MSIAAAILIQTERIDALSQEVSTLRQEIKDAEIDVHSRLAVQFILQQQKEIKALTEEVRALAIEVRELRAERQPGLFDS